MESFLRLAPLHLCTAVSRVATSLQTMGCYAKVRLQVCAEHCFLATLAGQIYRTTVQGVTIVKHVL